jgi:hypothetical protein
MEIKFTISLQQYTALLLTSIYMLHTRMVGGISSERTCTSLYNLSSYKHFYRREHYSYVMVYIT